METLISQFDTFGIAPPPALDDSLSEMIDAFESIRFKQRITNLYHIPYEEITDWDGDDTYFINHWDERRDEFGSTNTTPLSRYVIEYYPNIQRGDIITLLSPDDSRFPHGTYVWIKHLALPLFDIEQAPKIGLGIGINDFPPNYWGGILDGYKVRFNYDTLQCVQANMILVPHDGIMIYQAEVDIDGVIWLFKCVPDDPYNDQPPTYRQIEKWWSFYNIGNIHEVWLENY